MVAHWLVKSWAVLIAPYLTETDQAVHQSLNVMAAQEYFLLKAAISSSFGISSETHHLRFWRERFSARAQPRMVAQALKEHC